ncbi:MAG: hypothetical protein LUI04_00440, partial [Porphyromonadaceae bacterium]|nr:hypothetical protein [Porphyromonadaceae bacterium]
YLKTEGSDIFIRYDLCASILEKICSKPNWKSFAPIVSERKPFGLATDFFNKVGRRLNYRRTGIAILGLEKPDSKKPKRVVKYVSDTYFHHEDKDGNLKINEPIKSRLKGYKIFVPYAYGCGAIGETIPTQILGTPEFGPPNSACTETLLLIGPFKREHETKNALLYLNTKTFRLLVGLKKITQHGTSDVYSFVPMQDFSEEWSDEKLYKKYGFTHEEIAFIEKMIAPMP